MHQVRSLVRPFLGEATVAVVGQTIKKLQKMRLQRLTGRQLYFRDLMSVLGEWSQKNGGG
jgi:hypothetical protein